MYYIIVFVEVFFNLVWYDGVCYGLRVDGEFIEEMYECMCVIGFG